MLRGFFSLYFPPPPPRLPPLLLFFRPYEVVSGINHGSNNENQPSAAPPDCWEFGWWRQQAVGEGWRKDSRRTSSLTAVSKLRLAASAAPPAALRLPPADKRFLELIYDADMMKHNRNSFVFMTETSKKKEKKSDSHWAHKVTSLTDNFLPLVFFFKVTSQRLT